MKQILEVKGRPTVATPQRTTAIDWAASAWDHIMRLWRDSDGRTHVFPSPVSRREFIDDYVRNVEGS